MGLSSCDRVMDAACANRRMKLVAIYEQGQSGFYMDDLEWSNFTTAYENGHEFRVCVEAVEGYYDIVDLETGLMYDAISEYHFEEVV